MLDHILYLITMDKPSNGYGKIIIYQREGGYQTHWTHFFDRQEETDILYTGNHADEAWKTAEEIRQQKCKEGYTFSNPWFMASLSAVPHSYLFLRKLECFSDRYKELSLFQELKKWRRTTATSQNITPYYIATDKLLHMISTFIPHLPEELMQIPGIGRNKLEQYGDSILEMTKKYAQVYPYPLDWVTDRVTDEELTNWLLDQNLLKQERRRVIEKQEQEEKLRLLEAINDQVPYEEMSERLSLSGVNLMKRIRQLAKEGYDVLPYLQNEVERVKEKDVITDLAATLGNGRLKPIFEQLYGNGEEMPDKEKGKKYNRIRLICTYMQLKSVS
jgi:hypothetical protein